MTRLRLEAGTTFRSLRTRNFRLFFTGQLISQTGTWLEAIAVTWLMLQLTGSGLALGLVTAARFGPLLILGPWGGVLSDRLDKQRLMIATQTAFGVSALVEAVIVVTGHASPAIFYGFAMLFGVLTAIDSPARRALVGELVTADEVPNAVGLNSALMTGARTIGPAIAGALIAGPGAEWCFVVNAVSFLVVIEALRRMDRSQFRSSPRVAKAKGQLVAGFRYVWHTPLLFLPLLLAAVIGTLAFNFQVTLPLLAERDLGGDAGTFTMLYAMMSLGSVMGALTVARQRSIGLRFLLIGSTGMAIFMTALTLAPTTPFALAAAFPLGVTSFLVISGTNAMAQLQSDPEMRGRVLALISMVFLGSTPIGGPIVGWVSQELSPRAGLFLGAVATALVTVYVAHRARTVKPVIETEMAPIGPPASQLRVVGKAEGALGDDVALDLGGAAADGEGAGKQVAVVP